MLPYYYYYTTYTAAVLILLWLINDLLVVGCWKDCYRWYYALNNNMCIVCKIVSGVARKSGEKLPTITLLTTMNAEAWKTMIK